MTAMRLRRHRLSIPVVALALAAAPLAVVASAGPGQADPAVGAISGIVTDPSGDPLADVAVYANVWSDAEDDWVEVDDGWTESDGTYAIEDLPPDDYRVEFHNYSGGHYLSEWYPQAMTADEGDDVAVTAGMTKVIDVQLAAPSHVTGTVSDPNGALEDVTVSGYRRNQSTAQWDLIFHAVSGSDGTYDIDWLTAGSYILRFDDGSGHDYPSRWSGGASTDEEAAPFVVGRETTVSGIDMTLGELLTVESAPTISGTPQVGSTLQAQAGTWSPAAESVTYQWLVGGAPVGDGTPTYVPTAADIGKTVQLRTTAARHGYATTRSTSAPTAAVVAASAPTPPTSPTVPTTTPAITVVEKPTLTGKVVRGGKLSVDPGTYTPSNAIVSIAWLAGGKPIAKTSGTTLRLRGRTLKAVAGKAISMRITVTYPGATTVITVLKAKGTIKATGKKGTKK